MRSICIALDAMGGDFGPSVVVPAALDAIAQYPHLKVILVGDEQKLFPLLKSLPSHDESRLSVHHASEQVLMDDTPSLALRN